MRITHLGHACLLVEVAGTRLLIDPGGFSTEWHDLTGLQAVLVTHQHPDHLDVDHLPGLLAANPEALVLVDPGTADVLGDRGIRARTHDGTPVTVGDVTVTPVGTEHALIHEDIPRIPNVGVRLDAEDEPSIFHPGDALDADPGDVDVLAFPLNAPWQRSREMTGFLRRLNPPNAIPIHDGLLNDRGRRLYLRQADTLGGPDTSIRDLAGAGATEFAPGR
jgi:L-ascorbate metabolism protein UlaG (beta-lactamase superfamily)